MEPDVEKVPDREKDLGQGEGPGQEEGPEQEGSSFRHPQSQGAGGGGGKPVTDPGPQGFPDGLSLQRGRLPLQSQLQPLPEPPKRMSNSRIQI